LLVATHILLAPFMNDFTLLAVLPV
jgi:hypothetical protein